MHVVASIIFALWIAFWVSWLVASLGAKPGTTRWGRLGGVRIALVLAVLLLFRLGVLRGQGTTGDPWRQGVGTVLFISGLAVAVWARLSLGRNWGTPMSEKADPELVTAGPYRWVRHPIYSGILLAMVGTAVAVSWYWLVVAVLLGVYFLYSAYMEERFMTRRFPDRYPELKRSTKMLIPFIF